MKTGGNMKKWVILLGILFVFTNGVNAQHLPHQIGNQWNYDPQAVPGGIEYAAIAVDTIIINDKTYFKFERRHAYTGELLEITYDRLDGDSAYYRNYNGEDSLIINFNWPIGFTRVTTEDSICYEITKLANVATGYFWGFTTEFYQFQHGRWCIGMTDTLWTLFISEIVRKFGCRWAGEGRLEGAIIDSVTYGILYPLPVEFPIYNASVINNTVKLNWETVSETNNRGFEIQRKRNNENYIILGFVEVNGNTTSWSQYSFIDENVEPGLYLYRLKQVDFDGSFTYWASLEVYISAPLVFSLEQNYPNPFNPTTTIRFTIPQNERRETQDVSLKVFDILGNKIATLVNEEKQEGSYEVEFDGDGLPSGIYIYQLIAQNYIKTLKMMFIK
jgi:hypothetical protein